MEYDLGDNESNSPLFFLYNHQLHLWKNNEVIHLVEKFLPTGKMKVYRRMNGIKHCINLYCRWQRNTRLILTNPWCRK